MTAKKRIHVLFVTGSLSNESSGPFLSVLETAKALHEIGVRCTVLGTRRATEQMPSSRWDPVTIEALPLYGPVGWHWARGVEGWLDTHATNVDVIALQSVWLTLFRDVAVWARRRSVPLLLTAHGNFNPIPLSISIWKKRLARRLFMNRVFDSVACFHALTEHEYSGIRAFGLTQPVAIIPNGVRPPEESPAQTSPLAVANATSRERTCVFLGRLHPIKNLETLIVAWKKLQPHANGWRLVLAGPDSDNYAATLRPLIASLGLEADVQLVGPVFGREKSALLTRASLFVLPSHSEGMPMAALEAMAHGLPVVLSRASDVPGVRDNRCGWVTENTAEALSACLRQAIDTPVSERMAMGQRGMALTHDRYSWRQVSTELQDVFLWLIRSGPAPKSVRFD